MRAGLSRGLLGLLVASSLVLAACGGGTTGGGGSDASKPIRVVFIASLSGALASFSTSHVNSVRAAVNTINAGGGLLGRQLQLETIDDAGEPTKAVNVAQELVAAGDKPDIVIPGSFSASTVPILPILNRAHLFTVAIATSEAGNDPARFPTNFGVSPLTGEVMDGLMAHLKAQGVTRVAAAAASNETGNASLKALQSAAATAGVTITGTQSIAPSSVDATAALTALRSGDPQQLLYLGVSGPLVGTLVKSRMTLGWDVPVITDVTTSGNDLVSLGGGGANLAGISQQTAKFVVKSDPAQSTEAFRKFQAAFAALEPAPKLPVEAFAAGWSAMAFAQGAVLKAGSTDPDALAKAALDLQPTDLPLWFATTQPFDLSATNHYTKVTDFNFSPAGPRDATGSLVPTS